MKNFLFKFLLILFLIPLQGVATSIEDPNSFAGKQEMSGIRLEDYKGFERNWHFVTVRFRKDTNEMRLTYANDIAWEALSTNKIDYPDGAVIAKIGIATQDDLSFPSSAVPSGARRYQFMVRDKKKYKSTKGWGYALFDVDGKTFPENPANTVIACAACHNLVPERGYVFSQIMVGAPFVLHDPDRLKIGPTQLKFKKVAKNDLPKEVQLLLPADVLSVSFLEGELRQQLFQGTLDEVRPLLAQEAARAGMPALLLSIDKKRYSLVVQDATANCQTNMLGLRGINNQIIKANENYEIKFCYPKPI